MCCSIHNALIQAKQNAIEIKTAKVLVDTQLNVENIWNIPSQAGVELGDRFDMTHFRV